MQDLQPQFRIQSQELGSNSTRFIFEPLSQGFGHTFGNSLRRVLYSSIPGAAITSFSVSGINHQFSSLPGIQEDLVQIVLALKQVRLRYSKDTPAQISLSVKSVKEVTAGDFSGPSDVTIANPDLVIAHLTDKSAKLELEATVESGLGYSPVEEQPRTTLGTIRIDATFSPVTRVNFTVEATRVGRFTNYDKLLLDIITDGTITPAFALESAARTLVSYFSAVVSPQTTSPSVPSALPSVSSSVPGATLSIEEVDLPTRIANALQKAGIDTVGQLLATPYAELSKIKNLGGKSVKVIHLALKEKGFDLPA
ncbi:MAG: DNA-directed RNA polymerase subunit alpha [Microgenomates group bacterium Gr01-1014_16]|nr:MAG: DNA-directed RNA polymerase subunit alpha [Microgenomates group bacterium Gr01-1014_16]